MIAEGFPMVAEKIDLLGSHGKWNGSCPAFPCFFHFHGLVIGDHFADVVRAAVGSTVEDPSDATTLFG